MVRPAKNFSSTRSRWRASNDASSSSAWSRARISTPDWFGRDLRFFQIDDRHVAATLGGPLASGVIDEDLTHQTRGHGKKMRPPINRHLVDVHEPQIDLVNKRGRLKRMAGSLPSQLPACYLPELIVHQGYETLECAIASLTPVFQQTGHFVRLQSLSCFRIRRDH